MRRIHPLSFAARAAQGEKVKNAILTFSENFSHTFSFELTKEKVVT